MSRPIVTVNQTNGNLGRTAPSEDGNALLMATAVVAGDIAALGAIMGPFLSLEDVEAAGFTEDYDITNGVMAWHHASDFYEDENNTAGTKLWILPVADTVTLADMLDKDGSEASLIQQLKGSVKLVIATRIPDDAYVPTMTDGLENDIISAIGNAKALRTYEQSKQRPIDVIIEGRNISGTIAALKDLRAADGPNASGVCVVVDQDATVAAAHANFGKYARAGYVGGYMAGLPVQRDLGRVKNGPVKYTGTPKLSDGSTKIEELSDTNLDALHDKGYIFTVQHINKPGFYYNRSNAAVPLTDDYAYMTHSRVANKANRISVDVYTTELVDDILLNADGTLPASTIKDFQGKLEDAILANMVGEISAVTVYCDPAQNVASTDQIAAQLNLTPVGYGANIIVDLAFSINQ